jgi:diaminopimelate epimerase
MKFDFIKCHGSENDFVMIDEVSSDYGFSEDDRRLIARSMCDRQGPIGADGILFFLPSTKGDGMMRMFNPDGSEAEMCGNGIRCIGRLAHEVLGKAQFYIETMKGLYFMQEESPLSEGVSTYSVTINTVSFQPKSLPLHIEGESLLQGRLPLLSDKLLFTALSLTNPHLVAIVDEVRRHELEDVGHKANHSKALLPKGVNVTFCKPLGANSIFTGTYERGAGITFACGTGMSAASIAACLHYAADFEAWIDVYNQGGMVKCRVHQKDGQVASVQLLGNATYQFSAEAELSGNSLSLQMIQDFAEEEKAYSVLKQQSAHKNQLRP